MLGAPPPAFLQIYHYMNWAFDNFGIMQYTKGALSVDLEEEDCCQQSRADFFQKSTMELRVTNPSQPNGCR